MCIHAVLSFWVGIPEKTKRNSIRIISKCPTVDALAVFKPAKGDFSQHQSGNYPLSPYLAAPILAYFSDETILLLQFWMF
jgi:hypothetical protein